MICRVRSQTAFLILGLVCALSALAEQHQATVTPATAEKSAATAAKAKPAAAEAAKTTAAEPVKKGVAETAAPAEAGMKKFAPIAAVAKPDVLPGVSGARREIAPPPPRNSHPKPRKAAPPHVAPANTTATPGGHGEAALAAPAPAHTLHWSYEGEMGPHAWAKLAPEYAKCGGGERQSPIDIRDGMKLDLEPISFEYRPSIFKIVDNGHTIQANVNDWNYLSVMGRRFRLIQLHFHRPSEEAIDGRHFEMVVHLVHKDGEGRLGVVAVLVDNGARQPAIQTVLNNLPLEKGEEFGAATTLDPSRMLPENRRYFTYMGSLTTPPCTEDVLWIVMKQPVQASTEQLNLFSRMYPMNARPIQPSMGRVIKESN
jgi:carbonic anhydrase